MNTEKKQNDTSKVLRWVTSLSVGLISIGMIGFIYALIDSGSSDGSDGLSRALFGILGLQAIILGTGGAVVSATILALMKNKGDRSKQSAQSSSQFIVAAISIVLLAVVLYFIAMT